MWYGWSVNTANMIYAAFNSWFYIFQLIRSRSVKPVVLSVLTWSMHIGILMYIKSLVALTLSKIVAFKAQKGSLYVHGSRYLHAKWAEIHCLHNFTHSRTSFNSPILISSCLSCLFSRCLPANSGPQHGIQTALPLPKQQESNTKERPSVLRWQQPEIWLPAPGLE